MVNTREDALRLIAYTHYAPRGTRSFGPVRTLLYGGADYPQHANDTTGLRHHHCAKKELGLRQR